MQLKTVGQTLKNGLQSTLTGVFRTLPNADDVRFSKKS